MAKGTIIESVKDALAVASSIIESAQIETVWLLPPTMLVFAAQYRLPGKSKMVIQNGGRVRGLFSISSPYVEVARSLLAIGEDVRHLDEYEGVFFLVGDKKQSISSLHVSTRELSIDDQIVAFWSKDPNYADYLLLNFELAWTQGTDAGQRINELLKQGSPQA